MKNLKIKFYSLVLIGSAIVFSCNNPESTSEEHTHHNDGHDHQHATEHSHENEHSNTTEEYSGEKIKDLSLIIEEYLNLKNALTQDNSENASIAAENMLKMMASFDKTTLSEENLSEYKEIEEDMIENCNHIKENASEIAHQREHFVFLSKDIKDALDIVGTNEKLFVDFCPMANEGKGALWISEKEEIENPYMGSKMLNCGKIDGQFN